MADPTDPSQMLSSGLLQGPSLYDPAKGMMLIQNPEAVVALLASQGHPVPPDASPNISHRDAAQGLGAALSGFTDPLSGMGLPGPGAAPKGDRLTATNPPLVPPLDSWPGAGIPSQGPMPPEPQGPPLSARPSGPTPSPESVDSSGAVPLPATSEKPGDLSKPEPVAPPGMKMEQGPSVHPDKTVDSLSKALAGLTALKPDVLKPSSPQPFHTYNQISRSNLPQALMAEILGAAKPTTTFRLGEALRGRSFA